MKKINKSSLTLDLITRFYHIYVEEGEYNEGCFSDFELIYLIGLVLELRDFSDLEEVK